MRVLPDDREDTPPDALRREAQATGSRETGIAGMEIADYLGIIKKRFWVVVLIPVLAVVLVTAIILTRPTAYSATATVAAPWFIGNAPGDSYATANGASQFVADFVAAISVPPVVDAVAEATGASQDTIRENVTATPIGESTLIQVRYVTADERDAEPVARVLAIETLRFLFRPSAVAMLEDEAPTLPIERLELLLAQPETVTVSPRQIEPRGPELIRGMQVAIGGGLLLGLLVVILLEILPFDRVRRWAGPMLARLTSASHEPRGTPRSVPQEEAATPSTTNVVDGDGRADARSRPDHSDDAQPSARPPEERKIEPLTEERSAARPETDDARLAPRKPRPLKDRRAPGAKEPAAVRSEQVPQDALTTNETDVAGEDLQAHARRPAAIEGAARIEPKPQKTRKRRRSRANARRGSKGEDSRPAERSPDGRDIEPPAPDGLAAGPVADVVTRGTEDHPARET